MPLALFFIFYKKTRFEKGLWLIAAYLSFDFVFNLSLATIIPLEIDKYVYPIYTFVETILFAYFYMITFRQQSSKKWAVILMIGNSLCYLIYYFNTFFVLAKLPSIDSIPIGLETLMMIVLLLLYLFEQIKDPTTLFVYNKYSFWVATGIIVYLAGSLFIYSSVSLLTPKEVEKYWPFTNMFSMVKNIFFAVGIYWLTKQDDKPDDFLFSYENLN